MKVNYFYPLLAVLIVTTLFTITNASITGSAIVGNAANLDVEIPQGYKEILPGETALFTTKILNLANQGRIDITLEYSLIDNQNNIITKRSETLAIETQASFIGKLDIPKETIPGDYTIQVTMIKEGKDTISGTHFLKIRAPVEDKQPVNKTLIIISGSIILLLILVFFLKTPIKNLSKKMTIRSKIKKVIELKIKSKKITKDDLFDSKLPNNKVKEEQIF